MNIYLFVNNNDKNCPYCNEKLSLELLNDHIICHQLENQEKKNRNNNLNKRNYKNNQNNNISSINNNNYNHLNNNNYNMFSNFLTNIMDPLYQSLSKNENNNENDDENDDKDNDKNNNENYLNPLLNRNVDLNNDQNQNQNNYDNNRENNKNEMKETSMVELFEEMPKIFGSIDKTGNFYNNLKNSPFFNASLSLLKHFDNSPKKIKKRKNFKSSNKINIHRQRNNYNSSNEINEHQQRNKSNNKNDYDNNNINKIMENLPSSIVEDEILNSKKNNCLICSQKFNLGETIIILHCSNNFHFDCVKMWLKNQGLCPVCNNEITIDLMNQNKNIECHTCKMIE